MHYHSLISLCITNSLISIFGCCPELKWPYDIVSSVALFMRHTNFHFFNARCLDFAHQRIDLSAFDQELSLVEYSIRTGILSIFIGYPTDQRWYPFWRSFFCPSQSNRTCRPPPIPSREIQWDGVCPELHIIVTSNAPKTAEIKKLILS